MLRFTGPNWPAGCWQGRSPKVILASEEFPRGDLAYWALARSIERSPSLSWYLYLPCYISQCLLDHISLAQETPTQALWAGAATKISLALVIIWPCRHFLAFRSHFWQICRSAKPILGIMPSVGIVLISWGHIWQQWQVWDDILALLIALPWSCSGTSESGFLKFEKWKVKTKNFHSFSRSAKWKKMLSLFFEKCKVAKNAFTLFEKCKVKSKCFEIEIEKWKF